MKNDSSKLGIVLAAIVFALLAFFVVYPVVRAQEALPDFSRPKVIEDVERATEEGYDPYLILAHIRIESGAGALYIPSEKPYSKNTDTHTFARSHTGDYGRHQINCKWWMARQRKWKKGYKRFRNFPPEAEIKKCSDLYDDALNRIAYYHLLKKWEKRYARKGEKFGVPMWMGHYQTGGNPPKNLYLRKLNYFHHLYQSWWVENDT